MPPCKGRPNGPCPNNQDDSSVSWSIADIFLCKDCNDFRFGGGKTSDNTWSTDTMLTASTNMTSPLTLRNEMLCFIQQKSKVLPVDPLVKLCSDFYRSEEIVSARAAIEQFVEHRIPKRQKGPDFARKSVEDIVKLCIDSNVSLPVFHVTDLSRVPPVDVNHCDVSALLQEIQALRAEVRDITQLKSELVQLKADVKALSQSRNDVDNMTMNLAKLSQWPSLSKSPSVSDHGQHVPAKASCASVVTDIVQSANRGEKPFDEVRKTRRTQPICGKAKDQPMKAVDGSRRVNIFMTRFEPSATTTDIESLIKKVVPTCPGSRCPWTNRRAAL